MLSQEEIALVQGDWSKVEPIADTAATLFYDRLFAIDPDLKPLFKSDFAEQKRKLMQTIGVAVKGLNNLGTLLPAVQALGRRHTGYGVRPKDYATVGSALLWTLKQGLGAGFGPENETAWGKVYGVLSKTMIDASSGPSVAQGAAQPGS
jgi:hemoglobin-like flavoprotein